MSQMYIRRDLFIIRIVFGRIRKKMEGEDEWFECFCDA